MHADSVFDELGLVVKLATSSRTSHRETPRSNRFMECKACKGLSSLRRCDQVTQPKAPLDSAAMYPITWSPNNHLETGKRKTYQGHTFALCNPLDLDDNSSSFTQAGIPHLTNVASWRLTNAPPYTMMGKLHWCTSSHVHYHQMDGKLQACDSLEMLILNLPNSTLYLHILT